jgi:hypothetical protein
VAFIGEEGVLDRVTAVLPLENLWRPGARVFLRWNDRRVGCSASCFSHVVNVVIRIERTRLPERSNGPVGQAYAALRRATGKACKALFRRKAPWSTGARTRRISPPWPGKGFSF